MGKLHTSAASKRKTLRQKYKIKKKVADHKRSQKKAMKKAKAMGVKPKAKKDPGVPNLYPFKQNVLQQIEKRKLEEEEEKKKKKEVKKENRKRARDMSDVAASAEMKMMEYEQRVRLTQEESENPSFTATDTSRKAYFKEFRKVIEESDVILEVLDARDPLGCRCVDIEKYIAQRDPNKRVVLVLNKIDMVPKENIQQWLAYLRTQLPTVAFKSNTQQQHRRIGRVNVNVSKASEAQMKGKECLGADTLMKLLKNYTRNKNIKTTITVGVVGYPNVGKSSLINSLKRERVVGVGATPGVTKVKQEIYLDKNIRLMDCPGIVFAAKDTTETGILLRSNAIKVQQINDLAAAVELIVRQVPKEKLMTLYAIADFKDSREFLGHIAVKRGKMKKGGIPNYEEAARTIIQDWNSGVVPFYTVPPSLPAASSGVTSSSSASSSSASSVMIDEEGNSAAIVTQWAQEFDIDALLKDEEDVLNGACSSKEGEMLQGKESEFDATMLCDVDESDVAMDSTVQIEVGAIKKRKKSTDTTATEAVIGQNKLIKQEQKKKKKKEGSVSGVAMDDDNDEYTFANDFIPRVHMQEEDDDEDEDDNDGEDEDVSDDGDDDESGEEGGEISGDIDLE